MARNLTPGQIDVIGDETTASILDKLAGATPEAGKIGEEFISPIFETVAGAQAKADAAESDAITAASLDATTKANAALASALAADIQPATQAEVDNVAQVDKVVLARHLNTQLTTTTNALSIGNLDGDARGTNAINIQTNRNDTFQIASGFNSLAVGNENTASGAYSIAVGIANNSSALHSVSVGSINVASEQDSLAIGKSNTASGISSVSIGTNNTASGLYSTAVGITNQANAFRATVIGFQNIAGVDASAIGRVNTATGVISAAFGNENSATAFRSFAFGDALVVGTEHVVEVGISRTASALPRSTMRFHGNTGMASITIQDRAAPYGDGGAIQGVEPDNTIMRESFSIRRSGANLFIDVNIGGVVKTLNLGTAI